jgi:phenylacetate-CoA ligase
MYKQLPIWIQDLLVSGKGYLLKRQRYGSAFQAAFAAYLERSRWSEQEVNAFREGQRVTALERASRTPYYSELFSRLGAAWQDFKDPSAFSDIPILSRSELQEGMHRFRCRPPSFDDRIAMTSGTTGASLSLPISCNVEPDQWAAWWRYRGWHGIKRGERCALFASAPVVIGDKATRPYRFNYANNEIRFSIFHISRQSAHHYVSALNRHRPAWIHGNPTAIAILAKYIIEEEFPLAYCVRTVTVGSENLLPWQRNVIRKAFGVPPRQHYGLVEAVANISECPAGRLHVDEDFSYVEFVREEDSDTFGIVGTAFSNTAVSLLRYHTGDLARVSKTRCDCGRWGRIVEQLDGRLTDYIVLPGGRKVASLAAPFHDTECLLAAQIYQGEDGNLSVRYVPASGWKNDFLVGLESRLRLRVGHQIAITFEQVNEVEKTARGKTRLVVSGYKESNE